ncbi:MAG TPA: SpoIIE family protein phosphatase [Terracidiphilus sp.]|nr:SpoIIE family protein phosphatase [Terracidiphilus sp.]
MEIAFAECVPVTDASSVGEVRRTALSAAHRLGFDETRSGELALLATEASRNVLIHGGGGQVVLAGMNQASGPVARILALDHGQGIANLAQAMTDGYSTGGTMGGGLGAMKRIATTLEIFSGKTGTVVMLELGQVSATAKLQIAGIAVPYPGEKLCGDEWGYHYGNDRTVVALVDGLGHGWGAAEAAKEAIAVFHERAESEPGEILGYIDDALRKTRGAVAAVAEIRPNERVFVFAGVGNISGSIFSGGGSKSFVSHNGTLGLRVSKMQEFRSDWPPDGVLVLHSDGVQSKWDLSSYPGLIARHPAVIGGVLLRDFRRQRDDSSVVVVKAI